MAEWLRRWTWNPMGFPRAGSNPARSVLFLPFFSPCPFSYHGEMRLAKSKWGWFKTLFVSSGQRSKTTFLRKQNLKVGHWHVEVVLNCLCSCKSIFNAVFISCQTADVEVLLKRFESIMTTLGGCQQWAMKHSCIWHTHFNPLTPLHADDV